MTNHLPPLVLGHPGVIPGAPDWVIEPFVRYTAHWDATMKALRRFEDMAVRHPEELAPDDLSLLYGQFVVALWGNLESLVRRVSIDWLLHSPESGVIQQVRSLEGPLVEFAQLSPELQAEQLARLLENKVRAPLKTGVNRFESVLAVFGLSGPVDPWVTEQFYELAHVRNLLVHNAGVVDSRFARACPHSGGVIGESFVITSERFLFYVSAMVGYLTALLERLELYFREPPAAS